jgi:peptidoglycan-N-acetylglucosamine deacetylase
MRRSGSLRYAFVATVAAVTLVGCGSLPPPEGTTAPPAAPETTAAPEPTSEAPEPSPSGSETESPSPSDSSAQPTSEPTSGPTSEPTPTPARPAGPDCRKLKCIALTWDDGPFPEETGTLVKTLRRYEVKGTFFMLGQNVKAYPDSVKDIAATGSELANHSWSHASLPGLSNEGMRRELRRTDDAIEEVAGVRPTLMRPPYGAGNKRLDRVTRDLGLAEIYWDVDTLDWKYRDTGRLVDYVLENAERNQVVLMHDIHFSTVRAAPQIIRGLKQRGYTLVTVSELYPKLRPGGRYPVFGGRGYAKKSDYLPKRG